MAGFRRDGHILYILGCAVFVDLLMPCSIFSKSMQGDDLDTVYVQIFEGRKFYCFRG